MPDPTKPDPDPKNPRDPQGGQQATLNPTRDHVQGEPEEGAPQADAPPSKTPEPPKQPDPTKP